VSTRIRGTCAAWPSGPPTCGSPCARCRRSRRSERCASRPDGHHRDGGAFEVSAAPGRRG
jgi:hypothetical protein